MDSGNLEWLSHLSSLRLLDLSHVSLSKAIHWSQAINKLPSLIHLNLGDCSLPPLTTPSLSHVNSSAPLAFLDLSDNYDLASSVYPWVFNFSTTLVHLISISESNLNCLIPDAYGNMISLAYLDLRACALKGEIPEAYGNISSLTYLDMSENPLQGVIPDAFGNMRSLKYLDLSQNQLQGSIPIQLGTWLLLNDSISPWIDYGVQFRRHLRTWVPLHCRENLDTMEKGNTLTHSLWYNKNSQRYKIRTRRRRTQERLKQVLGTLSKDSISSHL